MDKQTRATALVAVLTAAGISVAYPAARGALDSQPLCQDGVTSLLDHIPDEYHDEIRAYDWGGSYVDMAPYVQAAIDWAAADSEHCRVLEVPPGLYPVMTPIDWPVGDGIREMRGTGNGIQMGAHGVSWLRATAPFAADADTCPKTDGHRCMLGIEQRNVTISRMWLDGDGQTDSGMQWRGYFNHPVHVAEVRFDAFAGGPAFVGGGFLELVLERSSLASPTSAPRYCVDIHSDQGDGYSMGAVNVSMRDNFVQCPIRIEGAPGIVEGNQFEFGLPPGPAAAVDLRGVSGSQMVLRDNYFELSIDESRTEPFVGVMAPSNGIVEGNRLLLPNGVKCDSPPNPDCLEGSIGISAVGMNNLLVTRNYLRGWETGIYMGARSNTHGVSSMVMANAYKRVADAIGGANTGIGVGAATTPVRSGLVTYDPDEGLRVIGRAMVGSYDVVGSSAAFWLGSANAYRVTTSAVIAHINGPPGLQFALHFDCSPCAMLDANAWGLAAQSSVRPKSGDVLSFLVDRHGKPHEVGDMSIRMPVQ